MPEKEGLLNASHCCLADAHLTRYLSRAFAGTRFTHLRTNKIFHIGDVISCVHADFGRLLPAFLSTADPLSSMHLQIAFSVTSFQFFGG